MPNDVAPFAIHATAVAVGDRGLVIRGPSKAGKSSLALQLITASAVERPILLVGDDRLIVSRRSPQVFVAPHPRIAGLIEKRGHGILAMPYRAEVQVLAIVDLGADYAETERCRLPCDFAGQNFPSLRFVKEHDWNERLALVLKWFVATSVAHRGLKSSSGCSYV